MNTKPVNAPSAFKTPLRLLVVSLVMMVMWLVGLVVFGGDALKLLLREMGTTEPAKPEVIGAILEKFMSVEMIATGTIGGIGMMLFQVAVVWILVLLIVRASRGGK
ncbi:hypothetical protein [Prosthecobacter sp.]|uniref:hypothetical protein n=1 Tax=Prosthecobacter sp. TaxID=1965333 RepID=UPI0037844988